MTRSKKGSSNPARPKYVLKLSLITAFLFISAHAFSQAPPGPPPPPPNPLNLFKKHKKDTTKKSDNANASNTPPAVATPPPGGPPPPPNPLNLFKKKKKDTTKNGRN